jgi:integrase
MEAFASAELPCRKSLEAMWCYGGADAVTGANSRAKLIPETRTKNGRAHFVPLPPLARSIVQAVLELVPQDQPYLFPSRSNRDQARPAHGFTIAMRRFGESLVGKNLEGAASWLVEPPSPHDLRRTLRTRLSMLGVPKEDRDAILNHTPSDVGSKHYDVYDRAKEKRQALTLWNDAIARILDTRGSLKGTAA